MIIRRFTVFDGSIYHPVLPLDFEKCTYVHERDEGSGQIFFRKKLSKELVFTNSQQGFNDFSFFRAYEQDDVLRCQELQIIIDRVCNGKWEQEWKGRFTTGQGKWDLDWCTFSIKPDVLDRYTCILTDTEEEINILDTPVKVQTQTVINPDYEYFVCRGADYYSCTLPEPVDSWALLKNHENQVDNVQIYLRERTVLACVDGIPEAPEGSGWQLQLDDCAGSNTATWVRFPQNYTYSPNNVTEGACSGSSGTVVELPPKREYLPVYVGTDWDNQSTNMAIWGYQVLPFVATGVKYKLLNPPLNCTITWSFLEIYGAPSIISGQGTDTLVVNFGSTFPGEQTLVCTVVLDCGGTKVVRLSIGNGNFSIIHEGASLVQGQRHICPGETALTYTLPDVPASGFDGGIVWLTGNGISILSGQGTNQITVDVDASAALGDAVLHGYYAHMGYGMQYEQFSANAAIERPPYTEPISGPQGICLGDPAVIYSVIPRSGSTYEWIVQGGTIIDGQGTYHIEVDWGSVLADVVPAFVSVKETLGVDCACDYIQVADCGPDGAPPYFWCNTSAVKIYKNQRMLMNVIEYLLSQMDCPDILLVSDFFEWNPIGDAPGYIAGDNYVYNAQNNYNLVTISQKSDVKDPNASNPATKGMWNFKKATAMLRYVYNVYWFIDEFGRFRLEHLKFFEALTGEDLTDFAYREKMRGTNIYTHLKEQLPKFERFRWMEALHTDFVGFEIRYPGLCVSQQERENRVEYTVEDITTDLTYIAENPEEIDSDGFVIFANFMNINSELEVIIEVGAVTGISAANMPHSWANLHRDLHKYGRVQASGYMNNVLTSFISWRNTIRQEPFELSLRNKCCDLINFDPANKIKTPLGENFLGSILARVERAEHIIQTESIKLTLGYPY